MEKRPKVARLTEPITFLATLEDRSRLDLLADSWRVGLSEAVRRLVFPALDAFENGPPHA